MWRRVCQRPAVISGVRGLLRSCSGRRVHSFAYDGEKLTPLLLFSRNASASVPPAEQFINSYTGKRWFSSTQALVDLPVRGIVEVPLAQTGEGIAECELLKWFVQEGDHVEEFQPLCEVQSDKATIEITSRYKGKVSQILYSPGDIVKVGETLLRMAVEESQVPSVSSNGLENTTHLNSELCKENIGGVLTTPAVRNLAKQYGVNMKDIHGTGKDGRVLKEDVQKYVDSKGMGGKESSATLHESLIEHVMGKEEKSPYQLAADGSQHEDKTVPLRGFQRSMVKSMTMVATVPHFHYLEEMNCDALVEFKASFQDANSDPDVKHTYLPLFIKSLSMALTKYPILNSTFREESYEVIYKGSHNIGIAMATPYGLVVPNIKKVQSLSILEITKELSRLQHLALNNKLSSEDISGGTITLSNIGAIGGKFGSPLINLPEVAIIAIGRIQKLPRFAEDGNVYPASIANVNIGADHRVVDGATVARFCNEWKHLVERPELLILQLR
ncbi:lipoamide acyltransferase component of branched-chain alpha-keto acid dehydrogenase complex, mitochondrial-like [Macadamia integrifolia]|uniref:lipoamide acyltransferase component of branched-chain alpha-keto acid dehydrogenase complex, mitochondrial-like n=1 Tax=Macadamia integrifolia TaxID=60698 RepID=UPI001C528EB8|nr:lipoamide acyltransferase component of branched-chain alpha-keto acid dehydrogenase complex, mitochondrial-like [Macadamia integrifolia]XP_042476144.1 lipoamide acyltransferase component of branched-chain alpha-keto acid dehydrogenase complex, mitochondrial-like [Macadamia integrifolia]